MRITRDNSSCVQALAVVFCWTVLVSQCGVLWGQDKPAGAAEEKQPPSKAGAQKPAVSPTPKKKPQQEQALPPLAVLLDEALEHNPDIRVAQSKVTEAEALLNRTRLTVIQQVMELRQAWEMQKQLVAGAVELKNSKQKEVQRVMTQDLVGALKNPREMESVTADYQQAEMEVVRAQARFAVLKAKLSYLLGSPLTNKEADLVKLRQRLRLKTKELAVHVQQKRLENLGAKLDEKTVVDVQDVPLSEVARYLGPLHGFNVVIDGGAIDKHNPPISIKAKGIKLGTLLQAIQEQHPQVMFVLQPEVLFVTTKDRIPKDAVPFDQFWKNGKRVP